MIDFDFYTCSKCGRQLAGADAACDHCGRAGVTRNLGVSDTIVLDVDFSVAVREVPKVPSARTGKSKHPREYSNKRGNWMQDQSQPTRQIQNIDRRAGRKLHLVIDEKTGRELLRKDEPLAGATGRGSDKPALRAAREERKSKKGSGQ